MPRCKKGTRKNRRTGECQPYKKPDAETRQQRKTMKAEAKAAKAEAKAAKAREKEEDYKGDLDAAREEFFEDKQYLYDQKGFLNDQEEDYLTPKQKKDLASTIKKVEALEKRIIKKYHLKKTEWVGDIEPVTVGMMQSRPIGQYMLPESQRKY